VYRSGYRRRGGDGGGVHRSDLGQISKRVDKEEGLLFFDQTAERLPLLLFVEQTKRKPVRQRLTTSN
jgi:hypothetical protein